VKEEADVHRYASGDCDDAPEVIRTQGVLKGQMRRVQSVILTSQRQISLAQSWAQSRSRGQSYSNMQDLALLERQFAPVTPCYELPRVSKTRLGVVCSAFGAVRSHGRIPSKPRKRSVKF